MRGAPTLEAALPRWAESTITDAADGLVTVALVWPERPILMNEIKRMHFRVEAQHIKRWRGAFTEMSQQCPRLEWATLVVHHEVGRACRRSSGHWTGAATTKRTASWSGASSPTTATRTSAASRSHSPSTRSVTP